MTLVATSAKASGSGSSTLLYDYTVAGVDKLSIDTGADAPSAGTAGTSAFPSTFSVLEIFIVASTDRAVAVDTLGVVLNNDTATTYDQDFILVQNVTVSGGSFPTVGAWQAIVHGASGSVYPSPIQIAIPGYGGTTFWKVATIMDAAHDAAGASIQASYRPGGYRSTAAITRVKIASTNGGTKLKIGSRLIICAR